MADTVYLLVEEPDEVRDAQAQYAGILGSITYVSLSSQAKYELMCQDLPHTDAHDYYDVEALAQETDAQYDILTQQCADLDTLSVKKLPALKEHAIRPFHFNYYNLKIILDTLRQRTALLNGLTERYGADNIYMYESRVDFTAPYIPKTARLTALLYAAHSASNVNNILPREFIRHPEERRQTQADSRVQNRLSRKIGRRLVLALQRYSTALQTKIVNITADHTIYTLSPFLPQHILNRLRIKRHYPAALSQIPENHTNLELEDAIFGHPVFEAMVDYAGSGSCPIIKTWMRAHILMPINTMIQYAADLDSRITKDNPLCLESRTYFSRSEHLIAAQFTKADKRIVGTHHGSLGIQKEKIFVSGDFEYVTDYFVWGEGVKDYIANHYPVPLNRAFDIHISGTAHFDTPLTLTRKELCACLDINPAKKIFIMPGSGFNHNIFYNWYLLMSEQQEYESQLKIIDYFANQDNCVFIYKGLNSWHYDEYHIADYMDKKNSSNLIYMNDIPLRALLPAVDGFITDRPSTSLLEAMHNNKICYSYNRWMTFPGDSAALYNRAAQHFQDAPSLLAQFNADSQNNFANVPRDSGYYGSYGNAITRDERETIFEDFIKTLINHPAGASA